MPFLNIRFTKDDLLTLHHAAGRERLSTWAREVLLSTATLSGPTPAQDSSRIEAREETLSRSRRASAEPVTQVGQPKPVKAELAYVPGEAAYPHERGCICNRMDQTCK